MSVLFPRPQVREQMLASFDPLVWPRAFYPHHIEFCFTATNDCSRNPNFDIVVTQGPPGQKVSGAAARQVWVMNT